MYGYAKRPSKLKRFFIGFICLVFVSFGSVFAYSMFLKKDVKTYNTTQDATATRLYNDEVEESKDNKNVLEEATKCVVGISKIKNKGASIFDLDSATNLGLGSRSYNF